MWKSIFSRGAQNDAAAVSVIRVAVAVAVIAKIMNILTVHCVCDENPPTKYVGKMTRIEVPLRTKRIKLQPKQQ